MTEQLTKLGPPSLGITAFSRVGTSYRCRTLLETDDTKVSTSATDKDTVMNNHEMGDY